MKRFFIIFLIIFAIGALFIHVNSYKSLALPMPTGPYAIGTTSYQLIDTRRIDPHVNNNHPRELMVQVWYPAEKNDLPKTSYITSERVREIQKQDCKALFKAKDSELNFFDTLKTHAADHAPIATNKSKYPVIIFSPGSGAPVIIYSNFIEDLASHGYIVFGINYPYLTNATEFPDGSIIKKMSVEELKKVWKVTTEDEIGAHEQRLWVADMQFVLDKLIEINTQDQNHLLTGKLDLMRIGLAGHSFGGGTSVQACALDARCKAVANIDGRFSYNPEFDHGFNKPALFIRNQNHKKDKKAQLLSQIDKMIYPAEYHEIPKMLHSSFSDIMLFITESDPKKQCASAHQRPIDVATGLQKTRKLLLEFFDKYLKN